MQDRAKIKRDRIKCAARTLFAVHGVEQVSVRDIVLAADVRQTGALNYYFGSKDDLLAELIEDLARLHDQQRMLAIDALERNGEPPQMRDLLRLMIAPAYFDSEENRVISSTLFPQVRRLKPDIYFGAVREHLVAWSRCVDHVRTLAPAMPAILFERRLAAAVDLQLSFLAERASDSDFKQMLGNQPSRLWDTQSAIEILLDQMEAIILGPISVPTMQALASDGLLEPADDRTTGAGA